jgi:hypothetical protein
LLGLAAAVAFSTPALSQTTGHAPSIDVIGTTLRVDLPDGTVREGADLVGAIMVIATGSHSRRVRIAAVERDSSDPRGEILLYDFRVVTPSGEAPLCEPDPDGRRLGMPLSGRSDPAGTLSAGAAGDFELVCTAGAQGKCARFGYGPWRQAADGRPMRDWFNACVRMLRGDYCGDGRAHTRAGALIDVSDRIGIQKPGDDPSLRFEAAWGPDGALCVAHTRVPDLIDLDGLARDCPRLVGKLGQAVCSENETAGLIFNRSR